MYIYITHAHLVTHTYREHMHMYWKHTCSVKLWIASFPAMLEPLASIPPNRLQRRAGAPEGKDHARSHAHMSGSYVGSMPARSKHAHVCRKCTRVYICMKPGSRGHIETIGPAGYSQILHVRVRDQGQRLTCVLPAYSSEHPKLTSSAALKQCLAP